MAVIMAVVVMIVPTFVMAVFMVVVTAGLKTAYVMDTPTGPTIVTLAAVQFTLATIMTQGWRLLRQRLQ